MLTWKAAKEILALTIKLQSSSNSDAGNSGYDRTDKMTAYAIGLQRAIEYHCHNDKVPPHIAKHCPHHAKLLNQPHTVRIGDNNV